MEGGGSRGEKHAVLTLWFSVNFAILDKIQALLPDLPDPVAM